MKLTGSQIFVEVLLEQGVDTLFGYPGGAVLNLYDELYRNQDRINHYMTAHEQGACHAADGYARATGKTGVVLATSGPGATNLVTGIATAYMDSVPLVAFTGNVGTAGLGKDSFQEAYIEGITMPITKHNYTVRHVEDLADIMRDAFRIAQSGRKGPVLVDIPKDITAASCEFTPAEAVKPEVRQDFDEKALKEAAELLNNAKRPVIYFGGGIILSGAADEMHRVMAKADIPATWTLMAKGTLEDDDPLNLGMIGMHGCFASNKAVDNADVLLAVGTRFSDRVALNPSKFAKSAKIIQFDIDASEMDKNVQVSLSVIGDAAVLLDKLNDLLNENSHEAWREAIEEWKRADYRPTDSDTVLKPHRILQTVAEMAGDDSIYVTDVGQHQMWAAQYLTHVKPRHFLTSGGLGTMGYGYGAAIGAQIAKGREQRVIHLTGDGSFHMNLNEAVTAVSYNLPVITVIFNNAVLGMVRQWQTLLYGKRYSSTDPQRKTNYVKVAEGFGAKGWHCETPAEFEAAFAEALKNDGPSWIECVIEKDEKVLPMIPAGATIADIIMADGKEAE